MTFSMELPTQLFRKNMRPASSFWLGSFGSEEQADRHAHELGLKASDTIAVRPHAVPPLTQQEFERQLRLIEKELTAARSQMHLPVNLETKLQCKARIVALEKKRSQFRLYVYSFVR